MRLINDTFYYDFSDVNQILSHYLDISAGYTYLAKSDVTTSQNVFNAPFIDCVDRKSDIDKAISTFDLFPGAWARFTRELDYNPDLSFKQKVLVKYIFDPRRFPPSGAISEIVDFLNGEPKPKLTGYEMPVVLMS